MAYRKQIDLNSGHIYYALDDATPGSIETQATHPVVEKEYIIKTEKSWTTIKSTSENIIDFNTISDINIHDK